jgi:hypothetical protein
MVMHWNTVSMAKAKLSKLVMPPLGPTQPLLHSVPLAVHWRPFPENAHGAGSSSATISTERRSRGMTQKRNNQDPRSNPQHPAPSALPQQNLNCAPPTPTPPPPHPPPPHPPPSKGYLEFPLSSGIQPLLVTTTHHPPLSIHALSASPRLTENGAACFALYRAPVLLASILSIGNRNGKSE